MIVVCPNCKGEVFVGDANCRACNADLSEICRDNREDDHDFVYDHVYDNPDSSEFD